MTFRSCSCPSIGGIVASWLLVAAAALPAVAPRAADAPAASPAAPTEPATKPAATRPARNHQDVLAEFNAAGAQLQQVINSPRVLYVASKRDEAAPRALPLVKQMIADADELLAAMPGAAGQFGQIREQLLVTAATFGDTAAEEQLKTMSQSTDLQAAASAKAALGLARWWRAAGDAAAQTKVADDVEAQFKADGENIPLAQLVTTMAKMGATTPELRQRLTNIVLDNLKGPHSDEIKTAIKVEMKLSTLEGKPLTIAGAKNDGKPFTTAEWKGKVILVDFWATWCQPCRMSLPRVKKAYADSHEKGLEIVGVSCDEKADELAGFLKQEADMPWPQLFDAGKPGWHELAKGFGVQKIPTMFLIDRKGIVRSVEAEEDFEEQIPKLLAEKPE